MRFRRLDPPIASPAGTAVSTDSSIPATTRHRLATKWTGNSPPNSLKKTSSTTIGVGRIGRFTSMAAICQMTSIPRLASSTSRRFIGFPWSASFLTLDQEGVSDTVIPFQETTPCAGSDIIPVLSTVSGFPAVGFSKMRASGLAVTQQQDFSSHRGGFFDVVRHDDQRDALLGAKFQR